VLSESAEQSRQPAGGPAFWWRLTDNLFRRIGWFLLPVLAMTLIGFSQANKSGAMFFSSATLSASTNPLVPDQQLSGMTPQLWESPASATSRIINERLRTDDFLTKVARDAGLSNALDSGLLNLSAVRTGIWASADGDSILSVNARTSDPQLSYALVSATIDQFQKYVTDTAASDSTEAESFWTERLQQLQSQRDDAQQRLASFIDDLPKLAPGEERDIIDSTTLTRLNDRLSALDAQVDDATAKLDQASLQHTQQAAQATQRITVIDEPSVPAAAQSTLMKRITIVGSFMFLGVVISVAALLVTTVLDQTVASSRDLLGLEGIALVATVPPVRFAGNGQANGRSLLPDRLRRRTSNHEGAKS
jgi:hypothetical protein